MDGFSVLAREHEVPVSSSHTCGQALLRLPSPVAPQSRHRLRVESDRTAAPSGPGLRDKNLVVDQNHRLLDRKRPFLEVEILPPGTTYEARALPVGATEVPPASPVFALYRCAQVCERTATLSGGIGTGGEEIQIRIPLSSVGAVEDGDLADVMAFSALGEAAAPSTAALDEVPLGTAPIPASTVAVGIGPAASPPGEVELEPTPHSGGSFTGSLDVDGLDGAHHVVVRGCLGERCGTASTPVDL